VNDPIKIPQLSTTSNTPTPQKLLKDDPIDINFMMSFILEMLKEGLDVT